MKILTIFIKIVFMEIKPTIIKMTLYLVAPTAKSSSVRQRRVHNGATFHCDDCDDWWLWHDFYLQLKSSGISSKRTEFIRTPHSSGIEPFTIRMIIVFNFKASSDANLWYLRHWNRLWIDCALKMPYWEVQRCCCCCCRCCRKSDSDAAVVVVDVLIDGRRGSKHCGKSHCRSWVCG